MATTKPFKRIIRPFADEFSTSEGSAESYMRFWEDSIVTHASYANDRQELWRAYKLIQKDLVHLFEYVEPCDNNLSTYSHRTYELLLRAATEVETNCRRILELNGYRNKKTNIEDYMKINAASKLGEYVVILDAWFPQKKTLQPFAPWNIGTHSLAWYQAYNDVKHHRNLDFPKASLENVLHAISGLYIVLFSQFVLPCHRNDLLLGEDYTTLSAADDVFSIVPPSTWTEPELYDFDWESIKDLADPFDRFPFK